MTGDRDLDLRLQRWLEARDAPVSASRVSEKILAELASVPQDRRLLPKLRGPVNGPPLRLLAVAALLVAAGGLAAIIGSDRQPAVVVVPSPLPSATPASSSTSTPVITPNRYPYVERRIDLLAQTWQVLATTSRVWVQTADVGMTAVDPSTGQPSGGVDRGTFVFLDGDELWVQKGVEQVLVRVDPLTGRELERFEGIPGFTVAKDGETMWGFDENGDVVRTDMATGEQLGSVDVPAEPKQIVLAAGSVWVACDAGNALVRIDPEAYEVIDTVDVGAGPVELELGFESLWVRNREHQLVRVDPVTGAVVAKLDNFGTSPSLGLSFGGGYTWASIGNGMAAVDPTTNEIARQVLLPGFMFMDSYWLDDTLWVSTAWDRLLLQVDVGSP